MTLGGPRLDVESCESTQVLVDTSLPEGALGIAHGQIARLVSRRGALEAEAHYSERVYPGLVWMALHFAEQKVNWLTHDVGDPLIGTPEYKVSTVRIETLPATVDDG